MVVRILTCKHASRAYPDVAGDVPKAVELSLGGRFSESPSLRALSCEAELLVPWDPAPGEPSFLLKGLIRVICLRYTRGYQRWRSGFDVAERWEEERLRHDRNVCRIVI